MREDDKNDWVDASLVVDLNYIKTGVEEYYGKKDYYSTGSIKDGSIKTEGSYTYSSRPSRANRVGKIGDILQARMKDTDKSVFITNDLNDQLFSTGFFQVRTNSKTLLSKYLFHYFKSFVFLNQKDSNCVGSTQSALNDKSAKNLFVPIAPLPEQRAIVAKIEALFSDLDKGIADLKKAQDQLKVYRQAVLKKAFEGEVILNAKNEKLIDITDKIGSGSTPKGGKKNYKSSGIPLVRSLNIHFDYIKYDELAFIDEQQAERLKNVIIQEGDVLLNITGASIGRVNIAPKDFENGRVNQHVSIIRPKNDAFRPIYLKYFLQSPSIQEWISNVNYGVTRQALTKSAQENLELPLPNIEQQHQIVQEIESRLSVCDKVEESITESLEKAKALRQSVLKKAFEGTLLSEEELAACKAAPDYEPASVLLEKIKAEKKKKK